MSFVWSLQWAKHEDVQRTRKFLLHSLLQVESQAKLGKGSVNENPESTSQMKPYDIAYATQSSRSGDMLNLLPLIHADAKEGKRVVFAGPETLRPWFDGIGYCAFEGLGLPLAGQVGATTQAAKLAETVVAPPYNAQPPITDSWAKEMWLLLGKLPLWKQNLPIVFDRRDAKREAILLDRMLFKKAVILLASEGRSSPFHSSSLLRVLVDLKFGAAYNVIDLSEIDLPHPFDFLALYEKAHCLVTVDTMHLHLARACPELPVVALVNDTLTEGLACPLWRKSPWFPQHVFHCGYSDFPVRALEMLNAIQNPNIAFKTKDKVLQVISSLDPGWEPRLDNHLEIVPGMFGRDGKNSSTKDALRYPFLKDAIRAAAACCFDGDLICLTRSATAINVIDGRTFKDLAPWFSARTIVREDGAQEFHPAYDLFCFSKTFWNEHGGDLPDLLWSDDHGWTQVMAQWMRLHGGKEVKGVCYRTAK